LKVINNLITIPCMVFMIVMLAAVSPLEAADKENCLMCHKYRFMGRIDENGKRINYNVDEFMISNSTHRNVPCRDCHTTVTKLPHDPVKEEVNCGNECHIKPPFSDENFSHAKIIDIYQKSAHGVKIEDSNELKKAKPNCKYCHLNPFFERVDEETISFDETLLRCLNCHQEKGVTQAYKHITHRLRRKTSRSPQEIVSLCSKCHEDLEQMKKFNVSKENLEAVETYKSSIHGKANALGSQETADCVSCHSTAAIHDIYKKDNPKAMVNEDNLTETCQQCHEEVNKGFIQIDVHSRIERDEKPVLFYLNTGLKLVLYQTVLGLTFLLLLETFGRRKDGIKFQLRRGTTWRGKSRRTFEKD
jgi:hypothetical protein